MKKKPTKQNAKLDTSTFQSEIIALDMASSIIDTTSDGIIVTNLKGEITFWNNGAAQMYKYSNKEIIGKHVTLLYKSDNELSAEDRIKGILKGKNYFNDEVQVLDKDKKTLTVLLSLNGVKNEKGDITHIVGITKDITEQKLAEKTLKESEQRFSKAFDNSPIPISILNFKTKKRLAVNIAYCKNFGYTKKELINRGDLCKKNLAADQNDFQLAVKKAKNEGAIVDHSFAMITKSGDLRQVLVNASKLYSDNDDIFITSYLDITDRKNAELELKKAQEIAHLGSWYLDTATGNITWSDELYKMYGFDPKLPIPPYSEHRKFLTRESWVLLNSSIENTIKTGEPYAIELKTKKKNGSDEWQWIYAQGEAILDAENNIIGLRGIAQDISERKRSEEILADSEKKLKAIFDHNFQLTGLLDSKGRILSVNQTALDFRGVKEEEVIGKFFWDTPWWESSQKDEVQSAIKYVAKGEFKRFETTNINKQGERAIIDFSLSPVFDDSGNVIYLVPEGRDITDRKIAEEKLEQANAELIDAVSSLNEMKRQLEDQNVYLKKELDMVFNFEEMVYGSAAFSNVLSDLERVAPTDATVLIFGESGTGKELLARALHNLSLRKDKTLIKVNCSAIPSELIESELFGHKKGSFTGAVSDKIGKFELADGGTLFLDEIGDLPLDMQPKLLRFLQEGEMEVVGSAKTKTLNVRVVAATNKDLKKEVKNEKFREDLYFRLNVFPIEIPALRDRKEDIPILVEHFVDKFGKKYRKDIKYIADSAMQDLRIYDWPGNIRELENLIERAVILSDNETLILPGFGSENGKRSRPISSIKLTLNDVQKNHILSVLEKAKWKIDGPDGAALILDLKPSTLRDKMKKLGIKRPGK